MDIVETLQRDLSHKEILKLKTAVIAQIKRYITDGYRSKTTVWKNAGGEITRQRVCQIELTKQELEDLSKILVQLESPKGCEK